MKLEAEEAKNTTASAMLQAPQSPHGDIIPVGLILVMGVRMGRSNPIHIDSYGSPLLQHFTRAGCPFGSAIIGLREPPIFPAMDPTQTILPPPCLVIMGQTAWQKKRFPSG